MVQPINFKTKTIIQGRQNPTFDSEFWIAAVDVGYSAVKAFSANSITCFPYYARKVDPSALTLKTPDSSDIQYRDSNGTWNVGALAQNMISSDEAMDSAATMYGRNRYYSPMFLVTARTGIALSMLSNQYGSPNGKTPIIQTGLPPAYMKSDSAFLIDVLSGHHTFEVKVGTGKWTKFDFDLPKENIYIMPQPMGSLISAGTDNKGKETYEAKKLNSSNLLIVDGGFGTLDVFNVKNGQLSSIETFDDLGMKRVFGDTANEIYKKFNVEVPIYAMQKYLQDGNVKVFDRANMKTELKSFADILDEQNKKVCMEAINRLRTMYNDFLDYQYIIVTGGTGAAWMPYIKDFLKNMEGLNVIGANQNDTLSHVFSNVRGYYLLRNKKLEQQLKK